MTLSDALRELNDAAYTAAKAARMAQSPLADQLKSMALDTDAMVDGRPLNRTEGSK